MALPELAGAVLGATILGSPHCVGMCGGFVCFVSGEAAGPRRWLAQAAYHIGRLTSYLALGAAAGWIGSGVEHAGFAIGIGRLAPIVAGTLMILWGGASIIRAARGRSGSVGSDPHASRIARVVAPAIRVIRSWPPAGRGFTVGLLTTLIPCGFLYAFVVIAGGTGGPSSGALVMSVFWLGTLPVLAALGLVADRAVQLLRLRQPIVSASILLVLGLLTLIGRLAVSNDHHHMMSAPHESGMTHGAP